MHIQVGDTELLMRAAQPGDDDFILSLVPRFVDFELPPGRKRPVVADGIRRDLLKHLEEPRPGSFLLIAETDDGSAAGFLHLQMVTDPFSGKMNCHISDIALATQWDGRGLGRALLDYSEAFAREHRCERLTLGAFPGNTRALSVYQAAGYHIDMLRLAKPL